MYKKNLSTFLPKVKMFGSNKRILVLFLCTIIILLPREVDGVWLEWGAWSNCTKICANGTKWRVRDCEDPQYGGMPCEGAYNVTNACNTDPCPVDGVLLSWSDWTNCSVFCGGGTQTRNRTCFGPFYGGADCEGEMLEQLDCNTHYCLIDGNWSLWNEWSGCSKSCNNGLQVRQRSCSEPVPQFGGEECPGKGSQRKICYLQICPQHGEWSYWSAWADCSQTCDWGYRERTRECTNPVPMFGGSDCIGFSNAWESCLVVICPVDGQWGPWGPWTTCSQLCGSNGTYSRIRSCDSPPALFGGEDCEGNATMISACYVTICEGDGSWSDWSDWGFCSKRCETGFQSRNRTCSNPPSIPPYGEDCKGRSNEMIDCNIHLCPVHGGWSSWSLWSQCSITCGGSTIVRSRLCTNPPPIFNGDPCSGDREEEMDCATDGCPVDGQWSDWSFWSSCPVSCARGEGVRTRTCSSPVPAWGGNECTLDDPTRETRICNDFPCPIHGGWSGWSALDPCPITCGGFDLYRYRNCSDPIPQFDGDHCEGAEYESMLCADVPCPVHGHLTAWTPWTECAVTCSGSIVNRTRTCNNPSPRHGGLPCTAPTKDWRTCATNSCPIDGFWSSWTSWLECSTTCGEGTQVSTRNCSNPQPQHGGMKCVGEDRIQVYCIIKKFCPESAPTPHNISIVVTISEDLVTLLASWQVDSPAKHVDFFDIQVALDGVTGLQVDSDLDKDWQNMISVPGVVLTVPLRDVNDTGIFNGPFSLRVVAHNQYGNTASETTKFDVAGILPKTGSAHHLISCYWFILSLTYFVVVI